MRAEAHALASKASAPGSGKGVRAPNHCPTWLAQGSRRRTRFGLPFRRIGRRLPVELEHARTGSSPGDADLRGSAGGAGGTESGSRNGAPTGLLSKVLRTTRSSPTLHGDDARAGAGGACPRHARRGASAPDRWLRCSLHGARRHRSALAPCRRRASPGRLRLRTTDVQQPQQLPPPLLFLPGASPLRFSGRPYRGQFQVSLAGRSLRAVNSVALEAYLFGVVPSEMPHTWLPEALKAQAVAARSYALAVRKTGSWFDLYPDTRSQVYSGIGGEKAAATAAVQATAGQVVLYGGRPVTTYFSVVRRADSIGGRGLVGTASPVPGGRRRPLRHDLTPSPLGTVRRLCRSARPGARLSGAPDRRTPRERAVGVRSDGDGNRHAG